jgi:hypothetical protein
MCIVLNQITKFQNNILFLIKSIFNNFIKKNAFCNVISVHSADYLHTFGYLQKYDNKKSMKIPNG